MMKSFQWIFIAGITLLWMIVASDTYGQGEKGTYDWLTLKGTSSLTGYMSNRQSNGQELPKQYLTLQLHSQLNLLGIPFGVSGLFSTMQKEFFQPINHISFRFDPGTLLRRSGKIPAKQFLQCLEVFELGRTRPEYSELMMQGGSVEGINLGMKYKCLYTALVYGRSRQFVGSSSFFSPQLAQKMFFGQLGIGHRNASYLHITLLKSRDCDQGAFIADRYHIRQPDTFVYATDTFYLPGDSIPLLTKPSEGLIAGVGSGTRLFGGRLFVSGEMAGSLFSSNILSEPLGLNLMPVWVEKIFKPRLSTSVSHAYEIKAAYHFQQTQVKGSYRKAAPGFRSPGVPLARQDYRSIEFSGGQSLVKRRLTLQPWVKSYSDNLSGTKEYTTNTFIWGINTLLRPIKAPYVSMIWSPSSQAFGSGSIKGFNKVSSFIVATGKHYHIGKKRPAFTSITWSRQDMISVFGENKREMVNSHVSVQQSIQLSTPFSLSFNVGYSSMQLTGFMTNRFLTTVRMGYRFSPKLSISGGFRSMLQGLDQHRTGLSGSVSWNTGKIGVLRIALEPFVYRDYADSGQHYNDYNIRFSFVSQW